MVALQKFLIRIADHPVLSFNKYFQTFLTAKQSVRISTLFKIKSVPSQSTFKNEQYLHFPCKKFLRTFSNVGIPGSEEGEFRSVHKDGRFFSQHECLVHDEKPIGGICRDERIHKYILRKNRRAR